MNVETNISLLLVEDDDNLGYVIKDNLEDEGYHTTLIKNGDLALQEFLDNKFDICILDVMLPSRDGFEIAEEIRKFDKATPIIFLTAKTLTEDKIRGFKLGADDYITKPFDFEELRLRIQAILSRTSKSNKSGPEKRSHQFQIGRFSFDSENQILKLGDTERKLTRKENKILRLLCLHEEKILSRELTLKSIWGNDDYFSGRSMDVFISKLRKYLKEDPSVEIVNIHGVGFKLMVKK